MIGLHHIGISVNDWVRLTVLASPIRRRRHIWRWITPCRVCHIELVGIPNLWKHRVIEPSIAHIKVVIVVLFVPLLRTLVHKPLISPLAIVINKGHLRHTNLVRTSVLLNVVVPLRQHPAVIRSWAFGLPLRVVRCSQSVVDIVQVSEHSLVVLVLLVKLLSQLKLTFYLLTHLFDILQSRFQVFISNLVLLIDLVILEFVLKFDAPWVQIDTIGERSSAIAPTTAKIGTRQLRLVLINVRFGRLRTHGGGHILILSLWLTF